MMHIRNATIEDIPLIRRLAEAIWWPAYSGILSDEQIAFMLKNGYSEEALKMQFSTDHSFLIAERNDTPVGFAGYTYPGDLLKINKLYILPSEQGMGTGRALIEHLAERAAEKGIQILELNVNRGNPAFGFYKKIGFEVVEEVDIPYHGFVLNDYVMQKVI